MSNTSKNQSLQVSIDQPDQLLSMAEDLSKFIKENKLFHNIQGKAYVNNEGWLYAGSRLGILPNIEQVLCLSTEKEIKYSASVSLVNIRTGAKVGSGFAICSNKENGKKNYQEFAICSMAQTRSIGKAYRNMLAWIIKAAGYEPCPAEEMDYEKPEPAQEQPLTTPAKQTAKSGYVPSDEPPMSFKKKFAGGTRGQVEMLFDLLMLLSDKDLEEAEEEFSKRGRSRSAMSDLITRYQAKVDELKTMDPATILHKKELIKLLAHPLITEEEQNEMIYNINKMNFSRIVKAIDNLKATIEERKATQFQTA